MTRLFALIALVFALAACEQAPESTPTPIGEVTRPDLVGLIDWDRSPSTVVFRAEVAGGERAEAFHSRSDVPYCTIYGDNRVIWTTASSRANNAVAWDVLSDESIRTFVETLATEEQFYSYNTGADLLLPSDTEPVVELLTLFVNDQVHQTDSFGGWDYEYFQNILQRCRSLSQQPKEFQPTAAWISAEHIEYDPNRPSILWDSESAGLRMAELADSGERRWIDDPIVRVLWERLRSGGTDVQFQDGSETYLVAVEVPNVTIAAPPAP